jgi:glycosyltransferase involved in cell wall biosynthesis
MKISASLIVKNEEVMLGKALKSIKGVDEIIVVDTGSEDKTIEIAKEHGAKVYTDYKWNDHFSEARNHSKKHCRGDWLLIIDADEILRVTIPTIRELLKQPFIKNKNVIMFNVDTGKETNIQPRMFRNLPDIQWVGAAHNLVCYVRPGQEAVSIGTNEAEIHRSTFNVKANFSPNHTKDKDRTLRIMSKELAKGPRVIGMNQYSRYLYYVSREWLNRQDAIKALYFLQDYVKIAPPTNEMADAWFLMATCYVALNKLNEAVDASLQTIKYLPEYKAAYAMLHNLAHPNIKKKWEKMFHMANNNGVLFVRSDAEKLVKDGKVKR